jgi:hypothetical protein
VKGRRAGAPEKVTRGGVARSKTTNTVREELAVEFYSIVNLALAQYGLTPAQRGKAAKRAMQLTSMPRVSGPVLSDSRDLGALLLEWSRNPLYVDADGKPRVLAIEGKGATFESLAQQFLSHKPLREVLDLICKSAEVVIRPHQRIALVGSVLVNLVGSPEGPLAHTIRQVDQLVQSTLYNIQMHKKGRVDGRMERLVIGTIPRKEFADLMRELQPQIHELLLSADSSLKRRHPTSVEELRAATAVSVGLYVSQENDFERAGIDPATRIKTAQREAKR